MQQANNQSSKCQNFSIIDENHIITFKEQYKVTIPGSEKTFAKIKGGWVSPRKAKAQSSTKIK